MSLMNKSVPAWVIQELEQLYRTGGGKWITIRKKLNGISDSIGYMLTKQEVYDLLFPEERMAPCGKEKRFIRFDLGYGYCEKMCPCKHDAKIRNTRETTLSRYGVENVFQSASIKDKIKETNTARYGSESAMHSNLVKEKQRKTVLEKYGVENISQCREVRDRVMETNRRRFGVNHPFQNAEIFQKALDTNIARYGLANPSKFFRQKSKETSLERYGVEHPLQNREIMEKIKETNMKKYGVGSTLELELVKKQIRETNISRYGYENPMQNRKIADRARATNLMRYGAVNPMQNREIVERARATNIGKYNRISHTQVHIDKNSLDILQDSKLLQYHFDGKSITMLSEELGINNTTFSRYWYSHGLPSLAKKSSYEKEISAFLAELGIEFTQNDKSILGGKELDFYLPDHNLAIEFNGSFHHSTARKTDHLYHRNKHLGCRDKNVRLVMIPQDSWDIRKQAVKNIVKDAIFGKPPELQNVSFKTITNEVANEFAHNHHVSGAELDPLFCMGAFLDNDLVAIMIFKNNNVVELSRFCYTRLVNLRDMFNTSVSIFDLTQVVSYVDLRFFDGIDLVDAGFSYMGCEKPDFRYLIGNLTWGRNEVSDIPFDELNKFPRIYDCGWLKYLWSHE